MEKNSKGLGLVLGSKKVNERIKELQEVCNTYAKNKEILKTLAMELYTQRKFYVEMLTSIPNELSHIDNLPFWCNQDIEELLLQIKDFQLAVEYEKSPGEFAEITDGTGRTAKIIGLPNNEKEIAKLGPTEAMAIATTIGTTSTGTTTIALSGVAATNAALAWLVGGTVAAGGVSVAGRSIALGLFGPIGWAIAGLGTISGIFVARFKNKSKITEVEKHLDIIKHDNENLEPKLQHLYELIARSDSNCNNRLMVSLKWLYGIQPKDYQQWDDNKKHELERLINAASNTVQLINERV
jgi:hypothetical protein